MKKRTERAPGRLALAAAAALALLAGCDRPAGSAGPGPAGPAAAPISRGSITATLHRYVESAAPEPYEEFTVTAAFPRYRPLDAGLVASLLGERVPEVDVAPDRCSPAAPLVQRRPRRIGPTDRTAIELADVGDLSVEWGGRRTTLSTQTFPDLLRVIDGVTYAADERRGLTFDPAETYTVHASGADEVARFDVVLDAPEDLGEVAIDGVSPAEQTPVVRRGEPLEITWEGSGGYGDEVIATISWSSGGLPLSMSCRMRDDGRFVVPGAATAALQDPLIAGEAEMTLARVRLTSFRAKGLASGEFGFVLSTSFLVRFDAVP